MYIPTDTDCSELIPGMCGGKMEPTMLDNCDSMHFEGVENVDINQGVGIDLADGVKAYDSTGLEIPFEYEPTEIDKCSVGEHEVIYKAIGADERLLPSICGDNFLSMACSGIGTLIAKRLVTIEQADPPTINGIDAATLSVDEPFDPMNGVTGVDDNGNPVDVTYSGKLADSAEGDIASFETDLTDPLKSLKVNLEPIQDLHGYDSPWVGGAGKNKFDLEKATLAPYGAYGLSFAKSGDKVVITGTADTAGNLSFSLVSDYDNYDLSGKGYVCQVFDVTSGYTVGAVWGFRTATEKAFAIRLDGITVGQNINCSMKLSVSATSQTSWTPYSNLCPISGHDEVGVSVVGKNLFDNSVMSNATTGAKYVTLNLKPNTEYTMSSDDPCKNGGAITDLFFCNIDETVNSTTNGVKLGKPITRTSDANGQLRVGYRVYEGWITPTQLMAYNTQIEFGSTATSYDPYSAESFHQEIEATYTPTVQDNEPYQFKRTGDVGGDRETDMLVGGTVAWNQLAKVDVAGFTQNGVTFTKDSSGVFFTVDGTATGAVSYQFKSGYQSTPIGHVFYISGYKKVGSNAGWMGYAGLTTDKGSGGIWKNTSEYNALPMRIDVRAGDTYDNTKIYPQYIDLTKMFGSTIADYIYSLEQANAGAGVAWFRKLFPKPYYEYNAGELMSVNTSAHNTVGFNAWDEETELGYYNVTTGEPATSSQNLRSKNFIPVVPNTSYYAKIPTGYIAICEYDADKNFIKCTQGIANSGITTTADTHFIRFHCTSAYGTTYNHDICINISWDGERDGEYEAYVKHSYALDSDLVLRGIPKLDASNNLYYDGDTYESDGTVTRKYGIVTFDGSDDETIYTGTSNYPFRILLPSNASDSSVPAQYVNSCTNYLTQVRQADTWGVAGTYSHANTSKYIYLKINDSMADVSDLRTYLASHPLTVVYPIATPTTETADPYTEIQKVTPIYGTEEFVDNRAVPIPVGNNTQYYTRDIYGGTLDLVSGVLTVTYAIEDMGDLNWTSSLLNGVISFYVLLSGAKLPSSNGVKANILSSAYETDTANNIYTDATSGRFSLNTSGYIQVRNSNYSDASTFKTAMSGQTICYELATPTTYQLTPQQIQTLLGRNNVWSEQGDVYVEFWKSITQGEFSYPLDGVYSIKYHAEDECGNVNDSTRAIIVVDVGMRTVLYEDGTFIINESTNDIATNVRLHGALIREYAPLDTDHPYVFSNEEQRPWNNDIALIRSVGIGTQIQPTDISYWFKGFENCEQFTLANMDTSATTEMYEVFRGCSSVTELDLSMFDTNEVRHTNFMFRDCTNLVTIFATDDFDLSNAWDSTLMFSECISLVGGSGTVFDPYYTNKEYARIDNPPTAPGYFTATE